MRVRSLASGLLLTWGSVACGASRHAVLMTIPYGPGPDEIDTTRVEHWDPWKTLIANFRVEDDESLWILTAGSVGQSLRRFRADDGRGVETDRVDLPPIPSGYDDFLLDGDGVILSRVLTDLKDQAAFYRIAGDSIVDRVVLERKVGFNRIRGWGLANLGRLRRTTGRLYNCFPPNSSCIRIGDAGLSPELVPDDLVPGIPIRTGEIVWADRLLVSRGVKPVLDLSGGPPAQLEDVFESGGFVIRRIAAGKRGREPQEWFELYSPEGVLRLKVSPVAQNPKSFEVGDGRNYYFTPEAIYQLLFTRTEMSLLRYGTKPGTPPPNIR